MASEVSTQQVAQAVLQAVQGFYPESDELASAQLSPTALPAIYNELQNAINETKSDIANLGRDRRSVLDTWVNEARRLHEDIVQHKAAEQEIRQLDGNSVHGMAKVADVLTQRNLLTSELAFNEDLAAVIRGLLLVDTKFEEVQEKAVTGRLDIASKELENGEKTLQNLQGVEGVLAAGLLREKGRRLRETLVASVDKCWSGLIHVDSKEGSMTVKREVMHSGVSFRGEVIVSSLQNLGSLKGKMDKLHQLLESTILAPLLKPNDGNRHSVSYIVDNDGTKIRTTNVTGDVNPHRLYNDLKTLLGFLWERLGPSNAPYLSKLLLPSLITQLLTVYLPSCIPSNLENLPLFEETLAETSKFEAYLEEKGWINKDESDLRDWARRSPKVWLNKRKQDALEKVRTVLGKGLGTPQAVERVETMTEVDGKLEQPLDQINGADEDQDMDNWDTKWESDEEKQDEGEKPEPTKGHSRRPSKAQGGSNLLIGDDEEDVSGWGLDDDDIDIDDQSKEDAPSEPARPKPAEQEQTMDVDWEWGDEDNEEGKPEEDSKANNNSVSTPANTKAPATTSAASLPATTREDNHKKDITLTETYKITSIPPAIVEIIFASLEEADGLSRDKYRTSSIAPAGPGILQIPALVIAVYRALSPAFYSHSPMYLYNDCVWLDEQLRNLQKTNALSDEVAKKLDLSNDWKAISTFGRRAYSREMESQRVIIQDLMDGAQGFTRCTDFPLSTECENAVRSVVDRLREVFASWKDVLSHSVLLQSVGSLLNTVVTKFINDIEDLADISADESTQLALFCAEISKLEELFQPINQPLTEESVPLTAVYCEKWLKFQYLANILEWTMVDISYFWKEGALVDFEPDELIDLVKALFADGDKRSKLIDEIRRGHH